MQTEFSQAELLARAAFADGQAEKWKGNAGYARTLRMEAWALRTAAEAITPKDIVVEHPDGTVSMLADVKIIDGTVRARRPDDQIRAAG